MKKNVSLIFGLGILFLLSGTRSFSGINPELQEESIIIASLDKYVDPKTRKARGSEEFDLACKKFNYLHEREGGAITEELIEAQGNCINILSYLIENLSVLNDSMSIMERMGLFSGRRLDLKEKAKEIDELKACKKEIANIALAFPKNYLLYRAVCKNKPQKVQTYLVGEDAADPNALILNGDSSLHLATYQGNPEIVEMLLGHGGDPLKRNINGATSFDIAERQRHNRIADQLRSQHIDNKKSSLFARLFRLKESLFRFIGLENTSLQAKLDTPQNHSPTRVARSLINWVCFWKR